MRLKIQTVLFKPNLEQFEKFIKSLDLCIKNAYPLFSEITIDIALNEGNKKVEVQIKSLVKKYLTSGIVNIRSNSTNLGHGAAHNKLFLEGNDCPNFVWIVNSDGILDPSCLRILIVSILEKSNASAVEAKQLPFDHPKVYNRRSLETKWSSGACLLIRGEAFVEVGGFDENIFLHGDDVDLSFRLRKKCGKLYFTPDALFWHSKRVEANGLPSISIAESIYGPLGALIVSWKYRQYIKFWIMSIQLRSSNLSVHRLVLQLFNLYKIDTKGCRKETSFSGGISPWRFSKHRY